MRFNFIILSLSFFFICTSGFFTPGRLNFKKHNSDKNKISYEKSPINIKLERAFKLMLKQTMEMDRLLEIQMKKEVPSNFRI